MASVRKKTCYDSWRPHNYLKQRQKIAFGAKNITSSFILHAMNSSVASRCSLGLPGVIQRGEDYSRKQKVGKCLFLCQKKKSSVTFEMNSPAP